MSQAEINAVLEQNNWEANEKNIKKAKRKIKNKKSAQESRKRKKEHMTDLEEKAKHYESKSSRLERELEKERSQNKSLMSQVRFGGILRMILPVLTSLDQSCPASSWACPASGRLGPILTGFRSALTDLNRSCPALSRP